MVTLVRLFHGGIVKEDGEFENMQDVTKMFDVAPILQEIVVGAYRNFRCGGR